MSSLADAYVVLGLSQESSLEEVKARYKQVALRTHPDKNPDNPDATLEFQRVSEAYRVVSNHLNSNEDEEYCGHDDSDDEVLMDLFMYLFSRHMSSRMYSGPQYPYFRGSREEYREREMEERREEAARRETENEARKVYEQQQKEKERKETEERQKQKKVAKKARAREKNKKAKQVARTLQESSQARRSAVFQAARDGDAAKVKEGIHEFSVDASSGEVRPGCEKFVKVAPKDPQETLSHIATRNGDAGLVEYLDRHGAEPDERNSDGLTAVHIALESGNVKVITYFFDTYPPKDADCQTIYDPPEGQSLLEIALRSFDSRIVDMILSSDLANAKDINRAWDWANSYGNGVSAEERKELENILGLLMRRGSFPSPSGSRSTCSGSSESMSAMSSSESEATEKEIPIAVKHEPRSGYHGRVRGSRSVAQSQSW